MNREEKWLVLLLRLCAAILLLAAVAIVMPFDWMAKTHAWLGMGELHETPLLNYLTRSLSALYAYHGAFMLVLSFDVRRYRGLVVFVGSANIVFGLFLLVLDVAVGMPFYWTLSEGPSIMLSGVLLLYLQRKAFPFQS
jgi:hypothetical protein